MNPNGKRLRDVDYPRIIFHAPERTFDRLFKESSLYDLKRTVRKKLGLPSDSSISLAQIRDGQAVDLDDDDDFEAFYTVAHSQWSVDVEIRLADTQTSQSTDEEIRPRKKHGEIHDSPSMSDNEAGVRTAGATESKKRKVVFAESSTEGVLSEEPRRKKKKSESDGAVNSTAVAPSSSHDITKKKKRKSKKDDSAANPVQEGNYDVPEQSGTVEASTSQRDPDIPVDDGQPAQPGLSDPSNVRQQSKAISSSSRRTSTVKAKLPSAPDQTLENQSHKEITPTPIAGTNAAGKRSAQSSASNTRRDSTLENSKSVSQEKDDHLAGSTPSENSQDASSDEDEVTQNTMLSSRSEHGSKSVSPDAEEENRADAGIVSAGKPPAAQMKDIVTDLLAAKRKLLAGNNAPVTTPEDSGSSSKIPAQSAELPERTRNSAKSSKVASKAFCLACTKASKHDLADCPLVQEGPLAIQKRIKALRATKKYSDKEKTPVIEGLKQVKQDIRDKAKQSTKESKVNAQSHSHPSSRPQDAEANDVSDRINDVAGVSSQARPVTQLSNKGSSGTSSTDSTPGAVVQLSAEKQADGDGSLNSLIPSHNVDLSAVDLQELIRGPKEALVSVNDLPSSDENDDDERMSGGPEEDEVEKNYRRLTSFGNDSSESEGSDAEQDNGNPTGSFANTEQHVSVSDSQDAIPEPGPPTVTQEQSIPRPSGRDDVSGDKDDANRRDGVLQEEESAIGTKSPVNGQEASDPVVSQEATEATLDALSAPTEEPDLSAMRAPSDASESIQSTQSSPRHVNGSSVIEQISDDTRVGPVRRSNRRTKPSVVTEETATEQDSGKRKRAATKTPKKDKSLTQVKDDILNSVARTIKSKIRATSVPADEHEPRTPGRKRARVTTKIERALNSKGNDTSTSKSRKKKDVPVPSENDPSITPSQDQTSLRSATPSVPEWTTLTPMEDDNITRDEPAPSSPLLRKSNANKKGVKKITKQSVVEKANEDLPNTLDDDLLFAPSTSQIPYPYSQKLHIEKRRENDSEDEQEVTSFLTPNGRTPHKYRRLSDIGTNPFAKRLNPNLAQHHSSKVDKVKELYGRRGKRGDNKSDSDSDSDSEPEKISHIPKTRMAGA